MEKWKCTRIDAVADMTTLSDEQIRDWSEKEYLSIEELETPGIKIGHIEFPVPILNVHYLSGRIPVLPLILDMTEEEIWNIVRFHNGVVTDPALPDYKSIIPLPDADGIHSMTGVAAIEQLLKNTQTPCEHIILHSVPVLPYEMRWKNDRYTPIEALYENVMHKTCTLRHILNIQAPEKIILFQISRLQDSVDHLISNGANGHSPITSHGIVMHSLEEIYQSIHGKTLSNVLPVIPDIKDENAIIECIYEHYDEALHLDDAQSSQAMNAIFASMRPFCEDLIQLNFRDSGKNFYHPSMRKFCEDLIQLNPGESRKRFYDSMLQYAQMGMEAVVLNFDPQKESIAEHFARPIYSHIQCFMNKIALFSL